MNHDPGGKTKWPLQSGVRGAAEFSECGLYRPWLSRFWGEHDLQYALWIGMNPSTARVEIDDPTVRKEQHFTRAMGLSGYIKCNVMDYRSTDPKKLLERGIKPVSTENFAIIAGMAEHASVIIAAWGVLKKPLRNFATSITLMLSDKQLMCMGLTKDGSPRHPLYLRNDSVPIIYREAMVP